ncbi:unnamed protein product [Camellia sinensis]
MEVLVISKNTIKPSNPTPSNLRHFQLSFLDQINHPRILPLIFYYPLGFEDNSRATNLKRSNQLKKSLADVLTKFYPLAGRVKKNLYIECNDEGVLYLEAQVNCQLSQIIGQQPINPHVELNKLLPFDRLNDAGDVLLAIQVTVFKCGGMAIGMCFSHKIADGLSTSTFANSWASAARAGHSNMVCPRLDSATYFPPRDMSCYNIKTGMTEEKMVSKRFLFNASAISTLKDKYANEIQPTRVEALSAFVWSRFVVATSDQVETQAEADVEAETSITKLYMLIHGLDLRMRMNPPLPESYFGNFSWVVMIMPCMDKTVEEGYGFVAKMREAIKKTKDSDYVKRIQEGDTLFSSMKRKGDDKSSQEPPREEAMRKKIEFGHFIFSSYCRFQLYEVDFGWGRPIWVSQATLPLKNRATFMPTRSGDGIEVWINLTDVDMAKFEADGVCLKFVSQASDR